MELRWETLEVAPFDGRRELVKVEGSRVWLLFVEARCAWG